MAQVEFEDFMKVGLTSMLKKRADELVKAGFSKEIYSGNQKNLRPQEEMEKFTNRLNAELEPIVKEYIAELSRANILSPDGIKSNPDKVHEITKRIEMELLRRMKT